MNLYKACIIEINPGRTLLSKSEHYLQNVSFDPKIFLNGDYRISDIIFEPTAGVIFVRKPYVSFISKKSARCVMIPQPASHPEQSKKGMYTIQCDVNTRVLSDIVVVADAAGYVSFLISGYLPPGSALQVLPKPSLRNEELTLKLNWI